VPVGEKQKIRFGPFEFDPDSGELFKNSHKLKLEGQPAEVLAILLGKPNSLITRDEFFKRLWPADTFVDSERILNADIWKIRQALGDDADHPKYIETLPRKGYRFIGKLNGTELVVLTRQQDPITISIATETPSVAPSDVAATSSPKSRVKSRIAFVTAGGLTMLLLALAYWAGKPATPRIVDVHRITNSQFQKAYGHILWSFLATDGSRVYFQERRTADNWVISQVAGTGGEVSDVPTQLKGVLHPNGLKPDGSELVVMQTLAEQENVKIAFWGVPLPAGSERKLPIPLPPEVRNITILWTLWGRDGNTLLYTQNQNKELYSVNRDGSNPRKLFTAANIVQPRLSPDGTRIRFSNQAFPGGALDESIWEANIDGSNVHRLFSDPKHQSMFGDWSADGKLFFFYQRKGPTSALWALPERGGWFGLRQPEPVLLYTGPLKLSGVASPNSKKLFAIGDDQRGELQIYDDRARQFVPYASGVSGCFVSFSPDRQWMTYVSYPDGTLWRSRVDGSQRQQLTFPPMGVVLPRWSPDGKLIAFVEVVAGDSSRVYVIPAEGGSPMLIAAGAFQPGDPTWSPDGKFIAYGGTFGEHVPRSEIRIHDLATGSWKKLPGSEGLFAPNWSPDGRYMLGSKVELPWNKMLLDFKTGQWTPLISGESIGGFPAWSHDSKYIYFAGNVDENKTGGSGGIVRLNVATRSVEPVLSLKNMPWTTYWFQPSGWSGLTPDDRVIVLKNTGSEDIYAFDLEY
jgi:Tol biopolymer transport system component/DNA-binding winged helix-turn-helix (wHTH) protein